MLPAWWKPKAGVTSFRPGEQHPRAVLNRSLVELLRTLHGEDPQVNTITALARRFGLKRETVRDAINCETWI